MDVQYWRALEHGARLGLFSGEINAAKISFERR
jgi:hypothetical protein